MRINADGTLVAGTVSTNNVARASIWSTSSGALTSLYQGTATASQVLGMNTSGSVLVGYGTFDGKAQALYWTGSGTSYTMHNLLETLEEEDVDMTGWNLIEATGASDDGTYIVGAGTLSNSDVTFIANVPAGGLSTTEALYQSLGAMGQVGPAVTGMGQLSMSRLGSVAGGQGMHFAVSAPGPATGAPSAGTGSETGLSSGDDMPGRLDLWVVGTVGTNIELNGDDLGLHGGVGLTWERGEWRVGCGLFGDSRDLDTSYNGNQDIQAVGPGAFVAYTPEGTGLEFRVSGLWQTVDLDLKRGYANGAGSATSKGSTNADVFGLSGRVQWARNWTDQLALTPFAEYTWQTTHIDGYSESGGPFPASFDSRNETSNSLRAGLRADASLLDKVATWAWIAWDHRFEDKSSGLGGTSLGLGSFTYAGSRVDQDWADTGLGASWDVTERLSANTALGFALGCDDDTMSDLNVTLGFSYQLW
ncbi:autotransporter outer membrane beta-barrel domain-containing protein [uncultured Pseudodesulfovibrio sp.]|uniref:autotransporter outer membrane beta-barrel domain-containing protein n=1 Tax=uncultured Pseudodesulfovibrio sp. TaxID=2035858 RepID=UPI0029C86266|nr:autotransporter outer membrane beta-barrel domain-containing protein [uncultured Pseudodesulfovibrio sp.]